MFTDISYETDVTESVKFYNAQNEEINRQKQLNKKRKNAEIHQRFFFSSQDYLKLIFQSIKNTN